MIVTIIDYKDNWKTLFTDEKEKINSLLISLNPVIEHIGSTSVPGLCAKPTIDMQVGLHNANDLDKTIGLMQKHYTYVKYFEPGWPSRRYYCKYKSENDAVVPSIIDVNDMPPVKQGLTSLVNIHVFVKDTADWIRHIAFKDYLIAHNDYRDAYCQLKKELVKKDYDDMIAYNDAKDGFVKKVQEKALEWYFSRSN